MKLRTLGVKALSGSGILEKFPHYQDTNRLDEIMRSDNIASRF